MKIEAPTLPNLRRLASTSPEQARDYLAHVADGLRRVGQVDAAGAVDKVLKASGDLVERLDQHQAQLGLLFPDTAHADWGKLQARRAQEVGWAAKAAETSSPQYLRGDVAPSLGAFKKLMLTTVSGHAFKLAESVKNSSHIPIPRAWMQGMIGDGPISVQGKLGNDGKTMNVEAFALDTDGAFSTFTFGRVKVSGVGDVSIATPRGDIEVTDPVLKAKLQHLPKLGVILPGEPNTEGPRPLYDRPVTQMFVLAGFRGPPQPVGDGKVSVSSDMAVGVYKQKPVELPAALADRTDHPGRVWLRGDFVVAPDGSLTKFVADYVSKETDGYEVSLVASVPDADPVQAAVTLAG